MTDLCMKDLHITLLQKQKDQLRYEAHKDQTEEVLQRYRSITEKK